MKTLNKQIVAALDNRAKKRYSLKPCECCGNVIKDKHPEALCQGWCNDCTKKEKE